MIWVLIGEIFVVQVVDTDLRTGIQSLHDLKIEVCVASKVEVLIAVYVVVEDELLVGVVTVDCPCVSSPAKALPLDVVRPVRVLNRYVWKGVDGTGNVSYQPPYQL